MTAVADRGSLFRHRTLLPVSAETAFAWHERPGALQRLLPPWQKLTLKSAAPNLHAGSKAEILLGVGPFWIPWVAEHTRYEPPHEFEDVQRSGPFKEFRHTHRMIPESAESCWLEDEVRFVPPGGWIGGKLATGFITRDLERMFRFRHATTAGDLALHDRYRHLPRMWVLISGASGLVGTALSAFLTTGGHDVVRLVRGRAAGENELAWDDLDTAAGAEVLARCQAVVHLSGRNIAESRWNPQVKQEILTSRGEPTRRLALALAEARNGPATWICASAIGFYGDRGAEVLTEQSPAGAGFLPEACQQWEDACKPAREAGIRVVNARFGIILSGRGGALTSMLPPFQFGFGGRIGSGKQWWSWVALDDAIGAIYHALMNDGVQGPMNVVAPDPVTNRQFTDTLASVLHRPAWIPVGRTLARLGLGEMADALLLASARVAPARLLETGYSFRWPTLRGALELELGR